MVARADEDVLRLDVAVDQPGLVRGVERVGDRVQDPQRPRALELAGEIISLRFGPRMSRIAMNSSPPTRRPRRP